MDFVSWFFISLSVLALIYIIYTGKSRKRIPVLVEVLFLGVYFGVLIVFLFPDILKWFESAFGVSSAVNFILYFSVFVLFGICYKLYQKSEKQRAEITKLIREIAIMKVEKKK